VPILVSREVMDSAGITPEEDIQEEEGGPGEMPQTELDEEGEERLSVFEDFLDKLENKHDDDDEEENKN
jgi:hypothetical protein